jgi:ribosomal protein S18 acetylase RimI-like enzyme
VRPASTALRSAALRSAQRKLAEEQIEAVETLVNVETEVDNLIMDIRSAIPDDAEVMAKLHVNAWRATYQGLVPDAFLEALTYDRRAERFRDSLSAGLEETYLAEQDGELLGILTIGVCRDEDVDREITGEIWGIYLAPQHWRQGIGRTLCRIGEQILLSRGYRITTLWVFGGNDRAMRFYEAMGYTADGANKVLDFGAPLEVVRYHKTLENAGTQER